MSVFAGRLTDALATAQDRFRGVGDQLILAAMWLFFLVFGTWAILAETDAFAVGVVTGSIIALGAIGLTLIYGILKFAHFAHGDSMMLAAYVAFFALTGKVVGERTDVELPWSLNDLPGATSSIPWPGEGEFSFGYGLLLALLVAVVATVALFILLDRLVYRPLRRRGSGIVIFAIASLGIALAMRSLMLMLWGASPRLYVPGIRPTTDLPFDVRIVPIRYSSSSLPSFSPPCYTSSSSAPSWARRCGLCPIILTSPWWPASTPSKW